jgi:hypothetical protein
LAVTLPFRHITKFGCLRGFLNRWQRTRGKAAQGKARNALAGSGTDETNEWETLVVVRSASTVSNGQTNAKSRISIDAEFDVNVLLS